MRLLAVPEIPKKHVSLCKQVRVLGTQHSIILSETRMYTAPVQNATDANQTPKADECALVRGKVANLAYMASSCRLGESSNSGNVSMQLGWVAPKHMRTSLARLLVLSGEP